MAFEFTITTSWLETTSLLDIIKIITIVITAIAAIFTMIKGYLEYELMNKAKKFELYIKYRKKLKEDEIFKNIIKCLVETSKTEDIKDISLMDKFLFIGFYEDIAILMKNKLITPEIAHYMFGYYAIKCWYNDNFWHDINKDSYYWHVFKDFVEKMEKIEIEIEKNRNLKLKI